MDDSQNLAVGEFVSARLAETQTFLDAHPKKGELPRSLRRRAASHKRRKRHPKRKRSENKPDTRRRRRKPSVFLKKENRIAASPKYLATHIWHAKRFKMQPTWDYRVPWFRRDVGDRFFQRQYLQNPIAQDLSFYQCIQVENEVEAFCDLLKLQTVSSEDQSYLYSSEKFEDFVGPYTLFKADKVYIISHPSVKLLPVCEAVASKCESIIKDRTNDFSIIQLIGTPEINIKTTMNVFEKQFRIEFEEDSLLNEGRFEIDGVEVLLERFSQAWIWLIFSEFSMKWWLGFQMEKSRALGWKNRKNLALHFGFHHFPLEYDIHWTAEEPEREGKSWLVRLHVVDRGRPKENAKVFEGDKKIGNVIYGSFDESKARGYGVAVFDCKPPGIVEFLNPESTVRRKCTTELILGDFCF